MAHAVVATRGMVLEKRATGEESTLVSIFTKERGLLLASAKAARRERSKLRYALEPFSLARFSFVHGRREWKLVGAEGIAFESKDVAPFKRAALARVVRLLKRLLPAEEPAPALFGCLELGAALCRNARTRTEAEGVEYVLVLRTLFELGYVQKTPELEPFLEAKGLSPWPASQVAAHRALLARAINESLRATGL